MCQTIPCNRADQLTGKGEKTDKMLDIADLVADRGGDPKKVKESQRRRFASEEIVDEVLALYEDARRSKDYTSYIHFSQPSCCEFAFICIYFF